MICRIIWYAGRKLTYYFGSVRSSAEVGLVNLRCADNLVVCSLIGWLGCQTLYVCRIDSFDFTACFSPAHNTYTMSYSTSLRAHIYSQMQLFNNGRIIKSHHQLRHYGIWLGDCRVRALTTVLNDCFYTAGQSLRRTVSQTVSQSDVNTCKSDWKCIIYLFTRCLQSDWTNKFTRVVIRRVINVVCSKCTEANEAMAAIIVH